MLKKKMIALMLILCLVGIYVPQGDAYAASGGGYTQPGNLVRVDPTITYQEWEGFGVSLCWWANVIGGWSEEKVDEIVDLAFDVDKGLGFNVARFNIGGGDAPGHDHMIAGANMPSYEPSLGVWDWDADANQRKILLKAIAKGVNITEAFSNSPPYWMTHEGCTAGRTGNLPNLRGDQYRNFADYLTEVVKHYRDEYGITFDYLSPVNEPDGVWPVPGRIQEGTTWDHNNIAGIFYDTYNSLEAKGLSTKLTGVDSTNVFLGFNILSQWLPLAGGFDRTKYMEKYNVHMYHGGEKREWFRDLAKHDNKKLWMSEISTYNYKGHDATHTEFTSSLGLSSTLIEDLRRLQPSSWSPWLLVEGEEQCIDGDINVNLIHAPYENNPNEEYYITKQFYAMGQFSKFIRPGDVFIDINNENMVATYNEQSRRVTIVVRNGSTSDIRYNIDLSRFTHISDYATTYRTSKTENIVKLANRAIYNGEFPITADAESITTYVLENMDFNTEKDGFHENFNGDLTQWIPSGGNWSIENGMMSASQISGDQFILRKDKTVTGDFVYEGDITVKAEGSAAALVFRSNLSGSRGYAVTLDRHQQIVKLFKMPYQQLAWAWKPIDLQTPSHIKVVGTGSNIKVYVNEESKPVFDINDSTYTGGYFGANVYNGRALFDNLVLKKKADDISNVVYYVDCGDSSPTVLEKGEKLGSRQSAENRQMGTDPVTGYKWGYKTYGGVYRHDIGDNNYDSVLFDEGDTQGKGITYKFQLDNNVPYKVTLGFRDFWKNGWRAQDIIFNGTKVTSNFVVGPLMIAKKYYNVLSEDGYLTIEINRTQENWGKDNDPGIAWIKIEQ